MILLSDSGSTKTDWCLADCDRVVVEVSTAGTNPFFQTPDEIAAEIDAHLLPRLQGQRVEEIAFYGAGCAFPDKIEIIRRVLADRFMEATIEVGSDMLAAARALCGHNRGVACILGTGSNSCLYDGQTIVQNVSPLGFILGDEGSGAVLGRRLVGDCLKRQLPAAVCDAFLSETGLTPAAILENVYRRPMPNRFLASLSPFLLRHIDVLEVSQLVADSFAAFLHRNVMQYPDVRALPIHFTGSVAYFYRSVLTEAVEAAELKMGTVLRAPMEGLLKYHAALEPCERCNLNKLNG